MFNRNRLFSCSDLKILVLSILIILYFQVVVFLLNCYDFYLKLWFSYHVRCKKNQIIVLTNKKAGF